MGQEQEKVIGSVCFSISSPELIRKCSVAEITTHKIFDVVEKAKVQWTWRGRRVKEKLKKDGRKRRKRKKEKEKVEQKELIVFYPRKFEKERVKGWHLSPLKGWKRVESFGVGEKPQGVEVIKGGLMDRRLGVYPSGVVSRGGVIVEPELDVEEPEEMEAYEVIEREQEAQRDMESKVEMATCGTCHNSPDGCLGHFGHIEFAEPVIHPAYVREIHKLLSVTCRNCGKLLPNKSKLCPDCKSERVEIKRYGKILREKRGKKYIIKLGKIIAFSERLKGSKKPKRLLPSEIRERLKRIKDDTLKRLGYDPKAMRPEWLVLEVLPVPPVTMRFSTLEGRKIEMVRYREQEVPDIWYDDLTFRLARIVFMNNNVKGLKKDWKEGNIKEKWYLRKLEKSSDKLQLRVDAYFNTLKKGLGGKWGRFRRNLSGKRVNFSARTVITPDPNLEISEVGVPEEIAKTLTVRERVSRRNLGILRKMVRNGPEKYPGVNSVISPEGKRIKLAELKEPEISALARMLNVGYEVESHLLDGDLVLFNRQPSLHRMSVLAHRVKVLPGRSFRLHPAVCPPYGADFDGDCMHLHLPRTEGVEKELDRMLVENNLVSPRYGYPIIGAIGDFVHAAYLLTKDGTFLTKEEFCNLAVAGGYFGALPDPKQNGLYTGKQLFSLFLPKDFNYHTKSEWVKKENEEKPDDVVVRNGELISGVIDRATIGAGRPNSILHAIAREYGNKLAFKFLQSIFPMLLKFVTNYGFSYSLDEVMLKEDVLKQLDSIINEACSKSEQIAKRGIDPQKESQIRGELNKAFKEACGIAWNSLPDSNSGIIMARTGASKAKERNIGQMTACLGQQYVKNMRIGVLDARYGKIFDTLPHFEDYLKPEGRGFVKSSLLKGLNPVEFFFHAQGGRDGMIQKSLGPRESGYMNRKLIYALGDLRVDSDLSVRDSYGRIVQFLYGEDGIDPAKSDHVEPGTTVGIIAAQSISEPSTQMTLRAKHYAGAMREITTGLPRLIQITDLPKKIKLKKVSMRIYLDEKNRYSKERATKLSKIVKGVEGILETSVEQENKEWFILTTGSNLGEVLELKDVDARRTLSNNPREVAEVLGIEAARTVIVEEIMKILEEQGLNVDIRHILLLADAMCVDGEPESIGRRGIAGKKKSVLARAAFEAPFKVLTEAAVRGEVDELKGIFENVVVGRTILAGADVA